jgi:hypothetical protein
MKLLKIAPMATAIVLYAATALAQHGHGAGSMGGGMGNSMGHGSMASSDHGPSNATSHGAASGSSHKPTLNDTLAKNPAIGGKIQTLTGMTADQACSGFKNLGQCVAAAHVSKNLGISFDCLKSDMTGTTPTGTSCPDGTGTKSMSLGKAIQTLAPTANAKDESKKGEVEAEQDMKSSGVKS